MGAVCRAPGRAPQGGRGEAAALPGSMGLKVGRAAPGRQSWRAAVGRGLRGSETPTEDGSTDSP